jgi:hypothetical protein
MLEQAHERWLRERQELFRDALNKVEANTTLQPDAPTLPRCDPPCNPVHPPCNPVHPPCHAVTNPATLCTHPATL